MKKAKKRIAILISALMITSSSTIYATEADAIVGKLSMDTSSYTMAPGGIYDFKASVSSSVLKQEDVKVWSSRDGIAKVTHIAGTGKYRITGPYNSRITLDHCYLFN